MKAKKKSVTVRVKSVANKTTAKKKTLRVDRSKKAKQASKAILVKKKNLTAKKSKAKIQSPEDRQRQIDQLILDHRENGRKLARSILRRWRVRMHAEEIDSIVDLSLCESARRYSPKFGASFLTFFFYHLRGHLVRSVTKAAQGDNIFLSFAKSMGIDSGDLNTFSNDVIWSYVPDNFIFGQRDIETPEHLVLRQEKINSCQNAYSKLDTLEKQVIDRSFSDEESIVDIAKNLGYSRCHVSRVKKEALCRLKGLLGKVEVETKKKIDVAPGRLVSIERQIQRRMRRKKFEGEHFTTANQLAA